MSRTTDQALSAEEREWRKSTQQMLSEFRVRLRRLEKRVTDIEHGCSPTVEVVEPNLSDILPGKDDLSGVERVK